MKTRTKIASLDAHLGVRRRLAAARREAHAIGHVTNVMLEIEREVARLDAEILDLEEKIARLSDDHKAQRESFGFLWWKVDVVLSDKKQLRELVTVLRSRREALAGEEGGRAIGAAKRLADFLTDAGRAEVADEAEAAAQVAPPEGGPNGSAAKTGRWG